MRQIRQRHSPQRVEVWFEDEARFGQKSTLTKVWAPRGERPCVKSQADYENIHVIAAACPGTGQAEGMLSEKLNYHVMEGFLDQLSQRLTQDRHAVLVLDRASYHRAKSLIVPSNITLMLLPPYSPELNPMENLWHYLRSHYWSNQIYVNKMTLSEAAQKGFETVQLQPENIKSICAVHYVQ